jgi:hypothetical protein
MEQKTLTHFSAFHIKRLSNTTSKKQKKKTIRALACLENLGQHSNVCDQGRIGHIKIKTKNDEVGKIP